jgi:5-methyltetrahydrofolate--homocysteine methyltransferase
MQELLTPIFQSILDGDHRSITDQVQAALQSGLPARDVLDRMIGAMAEVGRLFEEGEYYIPEMLVSARAMQTGLAVLKPHLAETHYRSAGRVAIGTVKGDLHDIGKNLVGMMLEGAGFEVVDLGVDVSSERFVEVAERVDVIALSSLLTTTMPNMKTIIAALDASGKRASTKVIVGGAPVTQAYADLIGADGYAPDASRAAGLVRSLLSEANRPAGE